MTPELRTRLQRLNAGFTALEIEPDRLVWRACDLLLDGVDTPALCELAGESPTQLDSREAGDLLRRMLSELGMRPMTYEEAGWFLGRETALQILGGSPRAEWTAGTWRITTTVCDEDDGVFAALTTYDVDPEPFRGYVREYLRPADERLAVIAPRAAAAP